LKVIDTYYMLATNRRIKFKWDKFGDTLRSAINKQSLENLVDIKKVRL